MKNCLICLLLIFTSCNSSRKIYPSGIDMKPPSIVLDHIYFMVPNHGKEAIKLLTETGFKVNPKIFQITGEGMASKLILLDNVSLEILWVDDSVSYNSIELLNRSKRKTWHPGNQISPFGVAFRRAPGVGDSLPIPNRASPPEPAGSWAKEGSFFNDITDVHDTLSTFLFVIPSYMGHDKSVAKRKEKTPEHFAHPNGVKALTNAVFYGPPHAIPAKEKYISNVDMLKFVKANENYAEFEFDHGKQNQIKDLRPALPLVLKW